MKISRTEPNAANLIASSLTAKWPELAALKHPAVWFAGSRVWRFLYGEQPDDDSDTDMFILGTGELDDEAAPVIAALGLTRSDRRPTYPKKNVVRPGGKYEHDRGRVDIWVFPGSVTEALENFPTESHAHCRAGFSFVHGLVVLPNEHRLDTTTQAKETDGTGIQEVRLTGSLRGPQCPPREGREGLGGGEGEAGDAHVCVDESEREVDRSLGGCEGGRVQCGSGELPEEG